MTTPTPVTSVTLDELTNMAPTTMINALVQLPQFYGSATTSNFNTGANGFFVSPGGGSLNLRGMGTKRTLTLLDGRRMVDSSLYGGPDINLFPQAVVRRVDTVTGGASAAYGTDAVAGVVNFILDTKFDGLKATVQRGQTSRGDNRNNEYSMTFGPQARRAQAHHPLGRALRRGSRLHLQRAATGTRAGACCRAPPPGPATASPIREFYPAPYITPPTPPTTESSPPGRPRPATPSPHPSAA